jgi:hypothetical protein
MRQLRLSVAEFEGVDLVNISEIASLFDHVETGTCPSPIRSW